MTLRRTKWAARPDLRAGVWSGRTGPLTAANVAGPAEAESEEIPHWMILVGGGLLAALMGALMGGAMAL